MSYRNHCAERRHAHAIRAGRRMDRFFAAVARQVQALIVARQAAKVAIASMPITFTRDGRLRIADQRRASRDVAA